MSYDVAVLGAGIVGVSTAVELQRRGLSVALIDRREPGEETSHGNAGIIQREGIHPAVFPRDPMAILRNALKLESRANYHLGDLARTAPFLWRYFRASAPERMKRTVKANIPLYERLVERHLALAEEAGARDLLRGDGWIKLCPTVRALKAQDEELEDIAALGLSFDVLDGDALQALEPHVNASAIAGAIHHKDTWTCRNPGALTKALGKLFEKMGGTFVQSAVSGIVRRRGGFTVTGNLEIDAGQIVVCLGPWSKSLLDNLGCRLPMGVKRGYHRHFRAAGNAYLTRPMIDETNGYVVAPMERGLRITSGVEFAAMDSPKTPVQLARVEGMVRDYFPLGETVDDEPWMGARPCFPDMLPVIGQAPGIEGLWLNFGHAHSGFMLGPVTGLLLAQMLTGEATFADPAPYAATRFLR